MADAVILMRILSVESKVSRMEDKLPIYGRQGYVDEVCDSVNPSIHDAYY